MLRFPAFSALALTLLSMSPAAALSTQAPPDPIEPPGSRFVACDNGLRCVRAPCPSRNAYDLDARRRVRGVDFDSSPLTDEERARLNAERGLYHASLAVVGHIEERPFTLPEGGEPRNRPVLVMSSVIGPAPPEAAALCRSGEAQPAPAPAR